MFRFTLTAAVLGLCCLVCVTKASSEPGKTASVKGPATKSLDGAGVPGKAITASKLPGATTKSLDGAGVPGKAISGSKLPASTIKSLDGAGVPGKATSGTKLPAVKKKSGTVGPCG